MTRESTIAELKTYFAISELVCPHTLGTFGEKAWQFLRTEQLQNLLVIRRDIVKVPITINNYPKGTFTQRGLRCNICQLVKTKTATNQLYLSAHITGAAFDFDAQGFTAEQVRSKLIEQQTLLPHPFRLEKNVSWVHFDTYNPCNTHFVNLF